MTPDLSGLPPTKYPHCISCSVCHSPATPYTIRSIGSFDDPSDRTEHVTEVPVADACTDGGAHSWQTLEQSAAERYKPRPENLVGLSTDLDGDYYRVDEHLGAWKVTPCCGASVKGVENGIVCRSCFEDMSWFPDGPARLQESDPPVLPASQTAITLDLSRLR